MADIMQDAERLADAMVGQCMESLEDCMERLGLEDTLELRQAFDQLAFECAGCNWWCEIGEANEGPDGEDVCDDCA